LNILEGIAFFLRRNGFQLTASEVEAARFFLDLAGAMETQDEGVDRLTNWIGANAIKLQSS
jgi:death on curing protein